MVLTVVLSTLVVYLAWISAGHKRKLPAVQCEHQSNAVRENALETEDNAMERS
jgi:hypothetical protein